MNEEFFTYMVLNITAISTQSISYSSMLVDLIFYMKLIFLYYMTYMMPVLIVLALINNAVALWLLYANPKTLGISQSMQLYYMAISASDFLNILGSHLWHYFGIL